MKLLSMYYYTANFMRESLINSIELMYVKKQVPYYRRTIDFDTLFGFNK